MMVSGARRRLFRGALVSVPLVPLSILCLLFSLSVRIAFGEAKMHLLYVDESGELTDATQRHFVLAGVSVFERTTHWVSQSLDELANKLYLKGADEIEFHGSPMRSGKGIWRQLDSRVRRLLIIEALNVGIVRQAKGVRLFACVVEKAALGNCNAMDFCFEHLVCRFDLFLQRCHTRLGHPQRGIMLFDESSAEQRLQSLARVFKRDGHALGKTRNYAEVPVFLDSRATRLIQLADLVAYAIFRHFEHADSRYWQVIKSRIDGGRGTGAGLVFLPYET